MIRPAPCPPAKAKTQTQQQTDFTAEGAPAPTLADEAAKAVAPSNPGRRKPSGSIRRR